MGFCYIRLVLSNNYVFWLKLFYTLTLSRACCLFIPVKMSNKHQIHTQEPYLDFGGGDFCDLGCGWRFEKFWWRWCGGMAIGNGHTGHSELAIGMVAHQSCRWKKKTYGSIKLLDFKVLRDQSQLYHRFQGLKEYFTFMFKLIYIKTWLIELRKFFFFFGFNLIIMLEKIRNNSATMIYR